MNIRTNPRIKVKIITPRILRSENSSPRPPHVIINNCGFINEDADRNVSRGAIGTLFLYKSITIGIVPYVHKGETIPIKDAMTIDTFGDLLTAF
jgi:hypothetical protein